jgi:hypothetical protein
MIKKLIEDFNNGDYDRIYEIFSDLKTFFTFLHRRGILNQVIDENYHAEEYWENDYLLFLSETDSEKFKITLEDILSDVKFINGNAYFIGSDLYDLSDFFCDDRYGSQGYAKSILSGDGNDYWIDDTTDDVYGDVIEQLDQTNFEVLREYVLQNLKGQKIRSGSDLMEEISDNQGNDDTLVVNSENIDEILSDEESMKYLLDDYLGDLEQNLYRIHRDAYNIALESDNYNEVWSELSRIFIGNPKWETRAVNGRSKPIEYFILEINDILYYINDYLINNRDYKERSLSSIGSFMDIYRDSFECLRLSLSDYPSHSDIRKHINDYFEIY